MNFIQGTLQMMEVGKGSVVIRLVPLLVTMLTVVILSDFGAIQTPIITIGGSFHGLNDMQSMDNAQLARQVARGRGFTTEFLRPHAVAQMRGFVVQHSDQSGKSRDLFPADKFPAGAPRVLPDTYNSPGYPYLLAGWFLVLHPEFEQLPAEIARSGVYAPDRWIPVLNQIFMALTAILVFSLGRRLFDQRVAWMALVAFLCTDLVWKYSLTGLSTSFLMFLATAMLYCMQEIFAVGELCFDSEERSFRAGWIWSVFLSILLVALFYTRLPLVVLLLPVVAWLILMPASRILLAGLVGLVVTCALAPWFFHLHAICGSFLGSNGPLVLHGLGDYKDNQIYCTTAIPSYEQIFRDAAHKEYSGFRWNFEHAWSMLGANPLVLLFGASVLHQFKRRRTRLFHWLLFISIPVILAANNLGSDAPADLDSWNVLIILMPCMVVIGSAFFFILLDRLALQLWLLNNLIVTAVLLLTASSLVLSLFTPPPGAFNFPPYWTPSIKQFAQFAQPDEWVTTDMPWATAWYGDRASLWLPDSITDFQNFHDNVCNTGVMMLTPVSWKGAISNFTTGEYKDWTFVLGAPPPADFPLPAHIMVGTVPNYGLWSDRPRWAR